MERDQQTLETGIGGTFQAPATGDRVSPRPPVVASPPDPEPAPEPAPDQPAPPTVRRACTELGREVARHARIVTTLPDVWERIDEFERAYFHMCAARAELKLLRRQLDTQGRTAALR